MCLFAFLASILFLWHVSRMKRIALISPYGIFIAFQMLYNLVPVVVSRMGGSELSLLVDAETINTQMALAASANFCFGAVYWSYYRKVTFTCADLVSSPRARRNYVLYSLPFFFVTCFVAVKYGLNAQAVFNLGVVQSAGGLFTIASYVKRGFVAVYLYYLYRFGLDRWAWFLLGCHAIIAILDGSRTTFLPIFLLTLFLFNGQGKKIRQRRRVYTIALLGLLISIGARAVIIQNDAFWVRLATPVTVEGIMGAYPSLQSIYMLSKETHPRLTFGASYLVDPIVWFLPQGETRDRNLFLQSWVKDSTVELDEDFAPMGGFYYIAESVAAFSYAGPAIVTTIFAFMLIWVERNANRYRLLYLTWMPTVGILFVKMIFGNVIKLFIVDLVFFGIFVFIRPASAVVPVVRTLFVD